MEGLYQGKYLIGFYDNDDFPIFIASTKKEFIEWYAKYFGVTKASPESVVRRNRIKHEIGQPEYVHPRTSGHVVLIRADTVTKDCFEEEDKDFLEFIEQNRTKTIKEIANEMGIAVRTLYRLRNLGKIDVPRRRKIVKKGGSK